MKKLSIAFVVILISLFIFSSKRDTANVSLSPEKKLIKPEKSIIQDVDDSVVKIDQEVTVWGPESLVQVERKFHKLEVSELEEALKKLEALSESRKLIQLANTRELTPNEKNKLLTIIRTKAALTRLLVEKNLDDLEQL